MSHSPFYLLDPPVGPDAPGATFVRAVDQLREATATARPDAMVVFGPDHFHASFYDCMPPFLVGTERLEGFGDYGSASGDLPVDSGLARAVFSGVTAAGFDPALSLRLVVDHGVAQTYELLVPGRDVPLVPIVINTAGPPLPGLRRCAALGRAVGEALRAASSTARVLVVGSGGLSHWIPSSDPAAPDVDAVRRSFLIEGRPDVARTAADREARVQALGGTDDALLAPEWDGRFLDLLASGDVEEVLGLSDAALEEQAGNGGQEVRTWLAAAAAWGGPVRWSRYEPVPQWLTGMAAATSLPVP